MKMMSPNVAIFWVTDPLYNPDAPSAALLTPATNISCAVVAGYTLNPTKSDVDSTMSICDSSKVETPTRYNYDGKLTFFREGDLLNTTSDYAKAFAFFKGPRTSGYLVRRVGLKSSVVPAAGQIVSSFKFIADRSQDLVADPAPIQFTIPFKKQGKMSLFKTLVA